MKVRDVSCAWSGDVAIAYQVVGAGVRTGECLPGERRLYALD